MKKVLTLFLLLATCGGAGWYFKIYQPGIAKADEAKADEQVVRVEKRDLDLTVEVSGDVAPAFQLEVKPEVGGKLKKVRVEPGALVKEGDLLVEIDDRDLLTERDTALTEIDGAKLQVDKDKRNFDRAKELFDSKLISREVYDNLSSLTALAQNALSKAERKLQIVDDRLRKTKVIAPTDGTVLTVPVTEGQVVIAAASVNNGTTLMTIANLSKLLVETHINQVDVARLKSNQSVKLRADSLKDAEMDATISFIAPVATTKNNVKGFQVQALINHPDAQLRPGMTVNMKVPIDRAEDAVSVPISAVFKGEGNSKVVYVRNGLTPEKRKVKTGLTNVDYVQILHGLSEGEEILLVEPRVRGKKS